MRNFSQVFGRPISYVWNFVKKLLNFVKLQMSIADVAFVLTIGIAW